LALTSLAIPLFDWVGMADAVGGFVVYQAEHMFKSSLM
jgi:hypothetical protein